MEAQDGPHYQNQGKGEDSHSQERVLVSSSSSHHPSIGRICTLPLLSSKTFGRRSLWSVQNKGQRLSVNTQKPVQQKPASALVNEKDRVMLDLKRAGQAPQVQSEAG